MMPLHSFAICLLSIMAVGSWAADTRPRLIATTDGEGDDKSSMVRFLVYHNEFDLEGIIYSSSTFHWEGTRWSGKEWIQEYIDLYGKCYPTLKQHATGYLSPKALKQRIYVGNIKGPGTMEKDTPGSDRIVEVLLDDDPRPVYLQAWGGANTIARALWKIQHEHPQDVARVSKKAIIYNIQNQDRTLRDYIKPDWPDLQCIVSYEQFRVMGYSWPKLMPKSMHSLFEREWIEANVRQNHGPLASVYKVANKGAAQRRNKQVGDYNSEGDSPSFLHQVDVGLRSLENPAFGGWGGRFIPESHRSSTWWGASDEEDLYKPIWRWLPAIQNDWATRMDWCVKSYDDANHPPIVRLAHAADLIANVETNTLTLDASPSTDPDGDQLTFHWWQYSAADSINEHVAITNAGSSKCSITFDPYYARTGDDIHLICEVTDNGTPRLTRYARVIIKVTENTHEAVIRRRLIEYADELKRNSPRQ